MTDILIADDHPLVLSGVEAVLTAGGHRVIASVHDGAEALEAVERLNPGLVLLDFRMPRRSGLDVLRTLRARGDNRPIVLMMAAIDRSSLAEALVLGAGGLLLKQSAPSQLLSCLDAVLAGSRWIDPALSRELASVPADDPVARLTMREQAIVRLVVEGMRNRDIGAELGMTEGNVKVTLHRIYEKVGVTNRVELAMLARDLFDAPAVAEGLVD